MPDISDLGVKSVEPVHPGMNKVTFVVDLDSWETGATNVIRLMADYGEHISLPWFAVLRRPGEKHSGVRNDVVLTNNRFLFREMDHVHEGGPLGTWGWSWYMVNTGTDVGPVRIEVGFVTTMMHPPHP